MLSRWAASRNGCERSPGRESRWRRIHADRELSSRLAYLKGPNDELKGIRRPLAAYNVLSAIA
jgi:hypothetical protein